MAYWPYMLRKANPYRDDEGKFTYGRECSF